MSWNIFGKKNKVEKLPPAIEIFQPTISLIGGVRFQDVGKGNYRLLESDTQIEVVERYNSMKILKHHAGKHFSVSCVMGDWCINGCQIFHRRNAESIFSKFDVPKSFRDEIYQAMDETKYDSAPFIEGNDYAYNRLQILNGAIGSNGCSYDEYATRFVLLLSEDKVAAVNYIKQLHDGNKFNLVHSCFSKIDKDLVREHVDVFREISQFYDLSYDIENIIFTSDELFERIKTYPDRYNERIVMDCINTCSSIGEEDLRNVPNTVVHALLYARRCSEQVRDVVKNEMQYRLENNTIKVTMGLFENTCKDARFAMAYDRSYSAEELYALIAYRPCVEVMKVVYDRMKPAENMPMNLRNAITIIEQFYDVK